MISSTSSSSCKGRLRVLWVSGFSWSPGVPGDEGGLVSDIRIADPSSVVHLYTCAWANFSSVNTLVPAVNITLL
jgi:hypothetical protein